LDPEKSGALENPGEPRASQAVQEARPMPPMPYKPEGKMHFHYPKELKMHVTLEALRERMPQCEIGEIYGVPQTLISIWKRAAIEAIRGNIHYKVRRTRASLQLEEPQAEDAEGDAVPSFPEADPETLQHLCWILRGAARQLEKDPATLRQLIRGERAG
jgi:hypothetical protein